MTTSTRPGPIGSSTDESYSDTVRRLAAAQKSGKGAPAYSRFVNRKFGRVFAAAAYQMGLTPNVVTAVSAVFSFAGIALLSLVSPTWWLGPVITVLLVVGYALDAADGQLARLQGGGSVTGEWLDHMVDCLKISALHMSVLISWYRFFGLDARWLLVPIGYTVVAAVSFFAQILNEQLLRNAKPAGEGEPAGGGASDERPSVVVSLLKIPTDYGLLCLVFVLLGAPVPFRVAYTLMFLGSTAYLVAACVKWYGQMRGLDRGRT